MKMKNLLEDMKDKEILVHTQCDHLETEIESEGVAPVVAVSVEVGKEEVGHVTETIVVEIAIVGANEVDHVSIEDAVVHVSIVGVVDPEVNLLIDVEAVIDRPDLTDDEADLEEMDFNRGL